MYPIYFLKSVMGTGYYSICIFLYTVAVKKNCYTV